MTRSVLELPTTTTRMPTTKRRDALMARRTAGSSFLSWGKWASRAHGFVALPRIPDLARGPGARSFSSESDRQAGNDSQGDAVFALRRRETAAPCADARGR